MFLDSFNPVNVMVCLLYATIGLELTCLHVPSVASSASMWTGQNDIVENNTSTKSWGMLKKFMFLALPILIIIATFLYPLAMIFSNEINPPWTELVVVLGLAFAIIGRAITFLSVLRIRSNNKQVDGSFQLHQDGLFSKSRNPIQLGMYIFCIGLLMLFPNIIFAMGILFYAIYMHYKITIEEQFLIKKFGKNYTDYFKSTRRYI